MSNATFKIEYFDGRIEQRTLPPGVYQVGRDVGDIVLGDTNTSARHAELRVEPGRVTIQDVGSTNGTYDSAGARISGPLVMAQGARMTLGHSKITLLPDGPPAGGTRLMPARELPGGGAPAPGGFAPPVQPPVQQPPAHVAPAAAVPPPPAAVYVPLAPAAAEPAPAPAPTPALAPVAPPAATQPAPTAPGPAYVPLAPPVGSEDKTVAILAYLTLLGFIAALVMHGNNKTRLGAFHLRQALGFLLTSLAGGIALNVAIALVTFLFSVVAPLLMLIPLVWSLIWGAFGLSMLVLWILGLMAAVGGEMKPLPVVGALYQKWFSKAFQ